MTRKICVALSGAIVAACPVFASAQVSPWVPPQGAGYVDTAYVRQEADEFFAGETEASLPVDLSLDSVLVSATYGLTDRLALDVRGGYAESEFTVDPVLAPRGGLDGFTDLLVGLRYQALDDSRGDPFTLALGIAALIEGDYDTGAITAVGDGASGIQVGIGTGKRFDRWTLSGDIGYRFRAEGVPDELFGSSQAAFRVTDRFSVSGGLAFVEAEDGLDIGGPGFTPARFPETEEDYRLWQLGAALALTDAVAVDVGYGRKFDGRNTARSDIIRVGLGYAF